MAKTIADYKRENKKLKGHIRLKRQILGELNHKLDQRDIRIERLEEMNDEQVNRIQQANTHFYNEVNKVTVLEKSIVNLIATIKPYDYESK